MQRDKMMSKRRMSSRRSITTNVVGKGSSLSMLPHVSNENLLSDVGSALEVDLPKAVPEIIEELDEDEDDVNFSDDSIS